MITGFSHVSIVVPDIEAAARMLADRFGLSVGERMVNEQQGVRLAYVELAGGKIELMEPRVRILPSRNFSSAIRRAASITSRSMFMTWSRPRALGESGVRVLGDGKPQHNVAGERIAFIHPADFLGALVELEQHDPKDRGDRP